MDKGNPEKAMTYKDRAISRLESLDVWTLIHSDAPLRLRRLRSCNEHVRAFANRLYVELGDDSSPPTLSLLEVAMELTGDWEEADVQLPKAAPGEVLRFLLKHHHLDENDLADIAPPAFIADILSGRCEITAPLARRLAKRFHIKASALI